jgi:hypothetical protein
VHLDWLTSKYLNLNKFHKFLKITKISKIKNTTKHKVRSGKIENRTGHALYRSCTCSLTLLVPEYICLEWNIARGVSIFKFDAHYWFDLTTHKMCVMTKIALGQKLTPCNGDWNWKKWKIFICTAILMFGPSKCSTNTTGDIWTKTDKILT